MRAYTNDNLVSPVTTQAFADWLRLDDDSDPLLGGLLIAATQTVIDYLQRDLISRDWVLVYDTLPIKDRQLTVDHWWYYCSRVELPYSNGGSAVSTVTVFGTVINADDYRVTDELPARLVFKNGFYPLFEDTDLPALTIAYTAGFGATEAAVPSAIKTAITMVAAYMYAHRGACEAAQAITFSGAATLLQPWRVRAGILL